MLIDVESYEAMIDELALFRDVRIAEEQVAVRKALETLIRDYTAHLGQHIAQMRRCHNHGVTSEFHWNVRDTNMKTSAVIEGQSPSELITK